jgi:hypothetical protein
MNLGARVPHPSFLRVRLLTFPFPFFLSSTCNAFDGVPFPRLAHQQVHMFRHHHITDQPKTVTRSNFVQDSHESVARTPRPQKWKPPVATESNKT